MWSNDPERAAASATRAGRANFAGPNPSAAQLQLARCYFVNYRCDGPGFGAEELPTDWRNWHTGYYDEDGPTATAIGQVVAGVRKPA